jgi:acetyltransferase-like isoleucine patch superfamily enzyme
MSDEIELPDMSDSDGEVAKENIKLQFHWYLSIFFVIYYCSYVIPGIVFIEYVLLIFIPLFLRVDNLFVVFTNLDSLLAFLAFPIVLIVSYLYHIRSFMIKYGKNAFMKGIFPWLANWFFNFVGTSVIEKGCTLEESVVTDRNVNVRKNCYIGVNSALSSHFVEGVFGNIVYFEIKLGENVTLGGFNNIAPGCELRDNSYLLPMAAATKHNLLKGNNYYFGMPLRRIFKKKTMDYLKISEEDLIRAENLRVKQESAKLERRKKEAEKNEKKT